MLEDPLARPQVPPDVGVEEFVATEQERKCTQLGRQ